MTGDITPNPVGCTVVSFDVLGKEFDAERRWVGSDLLLRVEPVGTFFLNIVTKQHYVGEGVLAALEGVDLEELASGETPTQQREPFVLNDREITEEVLVRKFVGRKIEEDLAASMWF